jgi:hypothetical protein
MNDKPPDRESGNGAGIVWGIALTLWAIFIYAFFYLRFVQDYFRWGGGG